MATQINIVEYYVAQATKRKILEEAEKPSPKEEAKKESTQGSESQGQTITTGFVGDYSYYKASSNHSNRYNRKAERLSVIVGRELDMPIKVERENNEDYLFINTFNDESEDLSVKNFEQHSMNTLCKHLCWRLS